MDTDRTDIKRELNIILVHRTVWQLNLPSTAAKIIPDEERSCVWRRGAKALQILRDSQLSYVDVS